MLCIFTGASYEFSEIIYSYIHTRFRAASYAETVCFVYPRLILKIEVEHFAVESV